jgi:hypothetical protein
MKSLVRNSGECRQPVCFLVAKRELIVERESFKLSRVRTLQKVFTAGSNSTRSFTWNLSVFEV